MAIITHFQGEDFTFSHSYDIEPKDNHFPLHIHDTHELFCLVKGKVGYIVEGHKYKLYPGTLLLMRSSESHKLIVNECSEYERYVINFNTEFLTENGFDKKLLAPYFNRDLGQKNRYLPKDFSHLTPLSFFEKIEIESKIVGEKNAVLANFTALLSSLNLAFLNKSSKDTDESGIISFVNDNLTKDITIEEIAANVHLSPSQLSRVFKKLTGTSVHEYIFFQEKLRLGESSVKASAECGFHDYSSFYRLYKKRFGTSPTKST